MGKILLSSIGNIQRQGWKKVITNIDITHNSKKAWATIKRLNSEKDVQPRIAAVTPNQVAHQLLLNGKHFNKTRGHVKKLKQNMSQVMPDSRQHLDPFTLTDLNLAMSHIKTGKASGEDGITTDLVLHFGEKAKTWFLSLFNNFASSFQTPKIWRRARVVA